jgi:hypothetical protein
MSLPKIEHKIFIGEVLSHDDKTLTLEHFISTEKQDDGGDIMRADGMKTRGRPVVLKQHGQDASQGNEPIAKPLGLRIGTSPSGMKGLIAKTQYYDGSNLIPPDNTGKRLYEKARDGFMPNWSIGYQIVKSKPIKNGRDVTEWKLHEYSQVAVGMNDEAVCAAEYKKLGITEDEVKKFFDNNKLFTQLFDEKKLPEEEVILKPKDVKSIADCTTICIAYNSMRTLFEGMMEEACKQLMITDNPMTGQEISQQLISEFSMLVEPYLTIYINQWRADLHIGGENPVPITPALEESVHKFLTEMKGQIVSVDVDLKGIEDIIKSKFDENKYITIESFKAFFDKYHVLSPAGGREPVKPKEDLYAKAIEGVTFKIGAK